LSDRAHCVLLGGLALIRSIHSNDIRDLFATDLLVEHLLCTPDFLPLFSADNPKSKTFTTFQMPKRIESTCTCEYGSSGSRCKWLRIHMVK